MTPKVNQKGEDGETQIPEAEEKGHRGRKAGAVLFPRNTLNEALTVPQVIWEKSAGNPFPLLDIASKLGNSPTSSTFRELIRSSQRYGLTNETYTQDLAKTISLTPLGNSIVAPTPEDDVNQLKRKALETPDIFKQVFGSLNDKIMPPSDVFKNMLIKSHHLLKSDADACHKVITQNISELGLSEEIQGKVYLRVGKLGTAPISEPPSEAMVTKPEDEQVKPITQPIQSTGGIAPPAPQEKQIPKQIFVAHGKNKRPLEQAVKILDEYGIAHSVAVEEANRGRPVSVKVAEEMKKCTAGIFIFTADEKTTDAEGKEVWRPSDNVVYELGAGSVLYGNRIVIFREEGVDFASDFKEIGYIEFEKNKLDAQGLPMMKELQSMGIIKFQVT